ncbi:MAG: hypothetical protein ACPGYY_01510 [Bacteroidia bacterium]
MNVVFIGYLAFVIGIFAFTIAMYYHLRMSFRFMVIRQDISLWKRGSLFLHNKLNDVKLDYYFKRFLRFSALTILLIILGGFLSSQ